MTAPLAIEASNVYKTFNRRSGSSQSVRALQDFNLAVEPGQVQALVGPNGAGKSTAIRVLTGLSRPDEGQVRLAGMDPWHQRRRTNRLLGAVLGHKTRLWSEFTVRESLRVVAASFSVPRTTVSPRIEALAEALDATSLLDRRTKELSLGQRMRTELIAALLHRPRVLFLDEPTVGLDVLSKRTFREHVRQLVTQEGVSVLLTSHDMDDVEHLADNVAVLDDGSVIFDGCLEALLEKFQGGSTLRIYIESLSRTEPISLAGVFGRVAPDGFIEFEVEGGKAAMAVMLNEALQRFRVDEVDIRSNSLESTIARIYESAR
mgnify:CR=1 FL=1